MNQYKYIALAIATVAIGVALHHTTALVPTPPQQTTVFAPIAKLSTFQDLTIITNQYRLDNKLPALVETLELDNSAQKKCDDMQTRNYWAHTINGELFYQFDQPALYYGENLAVGYFTASATLQAWISSPNHQANLVNPRFNRVGFAVCDGLVGHITVQELEQL